MFFQINLLIFQNPYEFFLKILFQKMFSIFWKMNVMLYEFWLFFRNKI